MNFAIAQNPTEILRIIIKVSNNFRYAFCLTFYFKNSYLLFHSVHNNVHSLINNWRKSKITTIEPINSKRILGTQEYVS